MVDRKKSEPVHTGPLTEAQKRQLAGYALEYERLADEIDVLAIDQKEILKSAKESGFDPKAIKEAVALLKIPPEERAQLDLFQSTVDEYSLALLAVRMKADRPFAPPLNATKN